MVKADENMTYPDFESPEFLKSHVCSILDFYAPHVFDPAGGFFHHFLDDGTVYDSETRHLVSSTRFVFNYVNAYFQTGESYHKDLAEHGFTFLNSAHRAADGHYIWQLKSGQVDDGRAMAYGHAFVLLAASYAQRLNISGAKETAYAVFDFMDKYFWEDAYSAYADERDTSLAILSDYRGQNANMHSVEALIASFETTNDIKFLTRAKQIAYQFCKVLAAKCDGQIWEHYNTSWQPDWKYNIDKPDDLFKPWGFQPGHQIEWAKLLLQLDNLSPEDWYLPTAIHLFDLAMDKGWDAEHGGLVYGYGPDGKFADAHKYFWVQAEAIATAWRLYQRTGTARYQQCYHQLWQWSWTHLVDHEYGGWYRILAQDGRRVEPYKSPAGKVDYHTMGACWDVLTVMGKHKLSLDW
ncbi:AGE family epimerase/isomerase [Alphaproteobacteria bacterium]|nr:AGE family epimerase/isomerase [Alphaproteobacteria bacterium]